MLSLCWRTSLGILISIIDHLSFSVVKFVVEFYSGWAYTVKQKGAEWDAEH